jgi:sec-independent protein translocase protein TatC
MEESQDIRFLEHLELLRKELIKIICIVACAAIPCWFLAPVILDFLLDFAAPVGFKLHYFTLLEPFLTRLKITVLLAVVLTLPVNVFLLWRFISPGLLEDERRAVRGPAVAMFFLALGERLYRLFSLFRLWFVFRSPLPGKICSRSSVSAILPIWC